MFRKRYVALAILLFVIGVVFGICMNEYDDMLFRSIFIVLAALSVVLFLLLMRKTDIKSNKIIVATAFAVASFSFGVIYLSFGNNTYDSMEIYDGYYDNAAFKIVEVNEDSLDARIIDSKTEALKGETIRVFLDNSREGLVAGDYFKAEVVYDYKELNQYRANGISLAASGSAYEFIDGQGFFYDIRKYISESIEELFVGFEYAPQIAKGVIIGDRSDLNSYIFNIYKVSGISHILAISGLHISIFTISLYHILLFMKAGRGISSIVSVIVAISYTALVGFIPGAVRSAIMISVAMILGIFFRNDDSFTTLSIALFIILIENPYSIYSVGVQLSFICTSGIMMFSPLLFKTSMLFVGKLRRSKGPLYIILKTLSSMLTSIVTATAASIFSFPILCMSFDTISYISPLVNVIAVPLFTYAIKLSFLAMIVSLFSNTLAMIFAYPAGVLFDLVTYIAGFFLNADMGFTSAHTPMILIPLLISVVFILFVLLKPSYKIRRFIVFSIIFTLSISTLTIHNNYAKNDSAVIEYGHSQAEYVYVLYEGKSMYVDIGGYTSYPNVAFENGLTDVETYVMLDFNRYSFERLDYFTATVSVDKLILPKAENSSDVTFVSQIKELANERKCDILFYTENYSEYLSDDSYVEILVDEEASNETLICVNILGHKFRFLGAGFDNNVVCDVAIAMNGYKSSTDKVYADRFFVSNDNDIIKNTSEKYYRFDETIKFKFDISERDYKIYEP